MKAISGEITANGRKFEKLRLLKNFKSSLKSETYGSLNSVKCAVFNFAEICLSNHKQEIERGLL